MRVPADKPELRLPHSWLDSWHAGGDIVRGFTRQGVGIWLSCGSSTIAVGRELTTIRLALNRKGHLMG